MAKLALRVLTSPGIAGATGAMVELAAYRFGLAMVPPNPHQTSDSVLIPKYYRPSDFVITYGNREVVYSFGWEAPSCSSAYRNFMGTQLLVQKVYPVNQQKLEISVLKTSQFSSLRQTPF